MGCKPSSRLVYLLRHGKIAIDNKERRYIGQMDIPLAAEGIWQAGLLQTEFSGKDITAIFCSDLSRSMDTAKAIAQKHGKEPIARQDLREISMGEWDGKTFREIAECFPGEYAKRGSNIAGYRIPGAETFVECQTRVFAAFTDILATTTGNVLIVGHAGINRLLLCHALGMPVNNLFRIAQDYGCINILQYNNEEFCVKRLNHLLY